MVKILQMQCADIEFAKALTDIEGWGHLEEDFERFSSLDPAGCHVAWLGGERAGIVTSATYGRYSFMGNLIVRKDLRGRGIGIKLMEEILVYLKRRGVRTVELDGVFRAVEAYRAMGFRDKYLSLRFQRPASKEKCIQKQKRSRDLNIGGILQFDREKTGIDRSMFLEHLLKGHLDTTYVSGGKQIKAYAVVRVRANGFLHIGPLVAEDAGAAADLTACISEENACTDLSIGIPCINSSMQQILVQRGFQHRPPSLRMYRGQRMEYEQNVYAIISADAG